MGTRTLNPARGAALLVVSLSLACGDPCAREARLTERRCGVEPPPDFDIGEQACSAEAEREARCALRHRADYCEWLDGLYTGTVVENRYTECLDD